MPKIKTRFYALCNNCQQELAVTVQSTITKGAMIIFNCSKCKATNFLSTSEILDKQ